MGLIMWEYDVALRSENTITQCFVHIMTG